MLKFEFSFKIVLMNSSALLIGAYAACLRTAYYRFAFSIWTSISPWDFTFSRLRLWRWQTSGTQHHIVSLKQTDLSWWRQSMRLWNLQQDYRPLYFRRLSSSFISPSERINHLTKAERISKKFGMDTVPLEATSYTYIFLKMTEFWDVGFWRWHSNHLWRVDQFLRDNSAYHPRLQSPP